MAKKKILTKKEFDRDMKEGYKTLLYIPYMYWASSKKPPTDAVTRKKVTHCCAIGAAAYGAEVPLATYIKRIPHHNAVQITNASDGAGGRARAIKAVSALKW